MHATCRPSWVVLETISGHVRFIKRIPTNQQPSKKIFTTHSTSQTSSRSQIKRQEPWTMTATVFSRKQILTDRTLYMKNNNTHQNHPSSGVTITSCDNGRKKMSHSFSSSQGGGWEWKTSGRNHTSNHAQQTFLEHPALQIGVWVCIYKTKQTHQGDRDMAKTRAWSQVLESHLVEKPNKQPKQRLYDNQHNTGMKIDVNCPHECLIPIKGNPFKLSCQRMSSKPRNHCLRNQRDVKSRSHQTI